MAKFTEWFENEAVDCGICSPPMEAQKAIDLLADYLLGEGWYTVMPISNQQVNTEIVFEILLKHSRAFRKEWKQYLKRQGR